MINPEEYKTNRPHCYSSQFNVECIADELNRRFPGAAASVKGTDPYRGLLTLEDMWRRGETPVI